MVQLRVTNRLVQSLVVSTCLLIVTAWWRRKRLASKPGVANASDAAATDPGLLKRYSSINDYHVPSTGYSYRIRTFYRQHLQASKLPSTPTPLPLLVFIHGLGGSAAQFTPLLTSLIGVGPCLCIDLPGCGLSSFTPTDWDAYTRDALTALLIRVIDKHRDIEHNQGIVLIGHSMGSSLAASLASPGSTCSLADHVLGVIAICPRASPISTRQESQLRTIIRMPTFIFDMWRKYDRKGGRESYSVRRHVGADADQETKKLQLRFNEQSQSDVWKRMAHGMLPRTLPDGTLRSAPGLQTWSNIKAPIMLVAGQADTLTSPEEVHQIEDAVKSSWMGSNTSEQTDSDISTTSSEEGGTHRTKIATFGPHKALKVSILPSPASHALMYAPETCRVLCGLIEAFLADHIDQRLSLGWQLSYLSTEGKWEVKNLEKWSKIEPVSEPIGGIFRAMKTMREVDDHHNPTVFSQTWRDRIWTVVDISHETPVYDPRNLEKNGISYNKFPTVSKLPPTEDEVDSFCSLIDMLREKWKKDNSPGAGREDQNPLIAVHCHYGFNRTGFFLVSYLVEREKWKLQDALNEFDQKRAPGIKHNHFVDALFVRYCAGLNRAPTF